MTVHDLVVTGARIVDGPLPDAHTHSDLSILRIDRVLVNGVPVLAEGEVTGELPGRVLKRT